MTLYNEAREMFAPLGLRVQGLAMDRRGSWSLALDSGTEVVIGRADARPRLQRFVRMLPQLLARNAQPLQRADLRYTNGFALSWREPGTGNGEPGIGTAPVSNAPASSDQITKTKLPATSIPHSLFPIPGTTT